MCPKCCEMTTLYGLCASVSKGEDFRYGDTQMCIDCLVDEPVGIEIRMADVLELKTKSQRRSINKRARKRELACAEEIDGGTTPASGSGIAKGDAVSDQLMIDDKFTRAKQYTLHLTDVLKTVAAARRTGRLGALKVGFNEGQAHRFNVAVLAWDDFMELTNAKS